MVKQNNFKEIEALINLIDDPDNIVFDEIRKQLFKYGTEIIPYLEKAWEISLEPSVQKRIEDIVHQIQYDNVKSELLQWIERDDDDILTGWMIITRYQYPELTEENIRIELNRIRKDIWLELNDDLTALEKINVFNHIFYNVYRFKGNMDDYNNPDNNFINKVLETKRGNSVSLGLIYMITAQSLDIPVYGINFPEHFLLAYPFTEENNSLVNYDYPDSILFYINALSKGNVFSRQEAEWFLQQLNLESNSKYFKPCSKHDIILRLLENLIVSYEKIHDLEKANEIKRLIDLMISY